MGDQTVSPDYSPRRDEAYDYLVRSHPEWSDVAITLDGQGIKVGPKQAPTNGTACQIRIHIVEPEQVNYSVGHTQLEEASWKPMEIKDLLESVVAWIEAARSGEITERIGTKNGYIVKSVVTGLDDDGPYRATESTLYLPWGVTWEEINYVAYPNVA